MLFATQGTDFAGAPYVSWLQRNPLGITETGKGVYDPLGNYIPFQYHDDPRPPAGSYNSSSMSGLSASMSNANDYGMGCFVDGVPTNCNRLLQSINRGLGHALHVSGPGGSRATLMRLGIIVTEGPLHNDTRLWGVWALTPGGQRAVEPNPQDNRRLTVDETSALRNRIADLLTDPKCLPFINELLGKVAEQNEDNPPFSTDPLKLFDEIDRRAGYNYSTAQKINTVNSNLGYPNAAVLLLPPSTFGTGRWPGRMEYIASAIAKAAFHETFHLAGRNRQYSDQALARAMLDIAAAHGWNLPTEADKQKILSDKFSASFYWDGVLRLKCRPSSQRR